MLERKDSRYRRVWQWLFVLLALGLAGCPETERLVDETDERAYRRGKSLVREGRHNEALSAFLSVIENRRVAPESHLEAGLIYLHEVSDPLAAIFHFRKYLEYMPNSDQSELVRERILTAQREYARQLPGATFASATERLDLADKVRQLQEANNELRQDLANARGRAQTAERELARVAAALEEARRAAEEGREVAPIFIQPPPAQRETAERERRGQAAETAPEESAPSTYVVRPGDTLSRISQRVYGTPGRWTEIFEANRDRLPSPNALQVGQELVIP
ncbi:MAG: LysM peptidoglycan-binding domain-containing protein [Opitutales bacterium]|nr:LysM peptidoglycan-binding domain-containing protein [Opitutales bacterium]